MRQRAVRQNTRSCGRFFLAGDAAHRPRSGKKPPPVSTVWRGVSSLLSLITNETV